MTTYEAFYANKRIEFEASSLYDAKEEAVKRLKVPRSKRGLVAIQIKGSQDFRYN